MPVSKSVGSARLDLNIDVEALTVKQRRAALKGLRHAAEEVRTYAQQLTPKDRGHLRASAEVTVDEAGLRAAISYDTPYAVYQHERLDLNHPVGESKFLEKALNARHQAATMIVAKYLREVLE